MIYAIVILVYALGCFLAYYFFDFVQEKYDFTRPQRAVGIVLWPVVALFSAVSFVFTCVLFCVVSVFHIVSEFGGFGK